LFKSTLMGNVTSELCFAYWESKFNAPFIASDNKCLTRRI
jgi:hypothetical protein